MISKEHFNESELRFLASFDSDFEGAQTIDGKLVWNLYENLIENRHQDFVNQRINLKIVSAILSRYCFSIWNNANQLSLLRHYGELEYGFFHLYNYAEIYDYETGLKADIETDSIL